MEYARVWVVTTQAAVGALGVVAVWCLVALAIRTQKEDQYWSGWRDAHDDVRPDR